MTEQWNAQPSVTSLYYTWIIIIYSSSKANIRFTISVVLCGQELWFPIWPFLITLSLLCFQMGHSANQRAAHVPAFAAAHEQEESRPGDRAGAFILLSWHWRWCVCIFKIYKNLNKTGWKYWRDVLEWISEILTLFFQCLSVETIVITPFLPVVAFGRPLPKLTQQ